MKMKKVLWVVLISITMNVFTSTSVMAAYLSDREKSYDARYANNFYKLVLAEMAISRNEWHNALALYVDLSKNSKNEEIRDKALDLALAMQSNQVAEQLLSHWLAQDPYSIPANVYKAKLLMAKGKPLAAQQTLDRLPPTSTHHNEIIFLQSLINIELKNYSAALSSFKDINNDDYTNSVAYFTAQIHEMLDNPSQALIWYQKVRPSEYYFQAKIRLSILLMQKGMYKEALLNAEPLVPRNNIEILSKVILVSNLQIALGLNNAAIKSLSQGLQVDPSNLKLLFMRGMAYANLNKVVLAEADLSEVLAVNENNPDALNALGYALATSTNRYQEAFEMLSRAIKISPSSPAIMDSYGWVLFKLEKYQEALIYLKRAYNLVPEAEIGAHYAVVLKAAGEVSQAKAVVRKINSLNHVPNSAIDILKRYNLYTYNE
jgi:tetratricopeptide (TPR) repeat protein